MAKYWTPERQEILRSAWQTSIKKAKEQGDNELLSDDGKKETKPRWSALDDFKLQQLLPKCTTIREIADQLGFSHYTVANAIKRLGLPKPKKKPGGNVKWIPAYDLKLIRLREAGFTLNEISLELGVCVATVAAAINRLNLVRPQYKKKSHHCNHEQTHR